MTHENEKPVSDEPNRPDSSERQDDDNNISEVDPQREIKLPSKEEGRKPADRFPGKDEKLR